MRSDRQRSRRPHTSDEHNRRGGNAMRHARWPDLRALMCLPRSGQRALDQIGHSLATDDPGLGMRFAFFTMLTRHEPMPATEQLPDRRQRFLRRAVLLPLIAISLAALLAASWLTPSPPACPAGPSTAAHASASASRGASCHPSPAIRLDTANMR
jgi:hypothetical protein